MLKATASTSTCTYNHRNQVKVEFRRVGFDVVGDGVDGDAPGEVAAEEDEGENTCCKEVTQDEAHVNTSKRDGDIQLIQYDIKTVHLKKG